MMPNQDVEVLIVGGGPVGLSTAIELGRAGIRTVVVERRRTHSLHPKAFGIHAKTMEIFRRWGLSGEIRNANGLAFEPFRAGWMTRMNGIDLGHIAIGADQAEVQQLLSWSPEVTCVCGQDVLEPILARHAGTYQTIDLRLGTEAKLLSQDDTAVQVELHDVETDERSTITARYVLGTDGVRSPTRIWAGLTETAEPSFGDLVNVRFEADLEALRAGRKYILFFVINKDTQGTFIWANGANDWIYNFEVTPDEDPLSYTPERCAELIRLATGQADLEIQIKSILHWQHTQAVADQWQADRVFIAGDAAHRFPPHGGFGMNSGIQDGENLAWKLRAVLRWGASPELLKTYETERRPVAVFNAEQCVLNTERMVETGWLITDRSVLAQIEQPEGEYMRTAIRGAIPKQREQFLSQGQQLGYIYSSSAVIPDGTEPETSSVTDYVRSGHPGARSPHHWLVGRDGAVFSTMDLGGGDFVLLAGSEGEDWKAVAEHVSVASGVPMEVFVIGSADLGEASGQDRWIDVVGVSPTGAVVVRPDGHIAIRLPQLSSDSAKQLESGLQAILHTNGTDQALRNLELM